MLGEGSRGFTLLEVLVALVVLVVGILGIFALVPTSVRSASDTVDDLVASQQVQSIVAALRLGARELRHEVWTGVAPARTLTHAFFFFPHPAALPAGQSPPAVYRADGTVDPAVFDHPACVLLPHGVEHVFVYPRCAPIGTENGQGNALVARDDFSRPAGEPLVRQVYGNAGFAADGSPLPGYAFALLLQRTRIDGRSVDGLYRVTVLLYHGFVPWDPASPAQEAQPVATYTTELMVGPMTLPAGVGR